MMLNSDVTYTNIRYFLNPESHVPLAVAEDVFNHSDTYFIPCDKKLVRIVRSYVEHPSSYIYAFKTGKLVGDRISYGLDFYSKLSLCINTDVLYWYENIDVSTPESIERFLKNAPTGFEFTPSKFLQSLDTHTLNRVYDPPKYGPHYIDIVDKYLKLHRGDYEYVLS